MEQKFQIELTRNDLVEIINYLIEESERTSKIYDLGIDIINFEYKTRTWILKLFGINMDIVSDFIYPTGKERSIRFMYETKREIEIADKIEKIDWKLYKDGKPKATNLKYYGIISKVETLVDYLIKSKNSLLD